MHRQPVPFLLENSFNFFCVEPPSTLYPLALFPQNSPLIYHWPAITFQVLGYSFCVYHLALFL